MKKAILFVLIFSFCYLSYSQDDWTLIHPYPTLNDLLDTHFNSEQEGWAVGKKGTIMYTNDGGDTWDIQHSDPEELLWSVFFIDDNEGWSVGWSSIYHTTDKGSTWEQQQRPPMFGDLTDVFFINHDTGWIVGTYRTVLKTVDGGDNWTKNMNSLADEKSFHSVTFTDEMHGCAVGGEMFFDGGFIMITDDGGQTWTDTSPPDSKGFTRVIFLDSLTGWICGWSGELLKTNDAGNTWIDKGSIYYNSLDDIYFFDDNYGMLLSGNYARLTFDAGESWDSVVYIGASSYVNKFSSWGYNEGIAVGNYACMSKTLDGGNTWEKVNQGLSASMNHIGFFNTLDGLAIDGYWGDGGLLRTIDGGYTWSSDTLIANGPFYKSIIDGSSCYLLNDSSQMMKTINSGADWELLDVPDITSFYYGMQFVSENTGYMCGSDGIFVKTINGGTTWIDKSFTNNYNLRSLYFFNEELGWLIDYTSKEILKTENGGDSWVSTTLGDVYTFEPLSIFFTNEEEGFATTNEGVLFKTTDSGDTWEEFYVFSYGSGSEIYFINEMEAWYRTSASIYHTYDGGLSWTRGQVPGHMQSMFFLENQGWLGGGHGLVATCSFTVGLNEYINMATSISVFPNPADEDIEVKLVDKSDEILDIKIFNLQGQQVLHFPKLAMMYSFKFNISDLKSGIYILNITSTDSEHLIKLIVQ